MVIYGVALILDTYPRFDAMQEDESTFISGTPDAGAGGGSRCTTFWRYAFYAVFHRITPESYFRPASMQFSAGELDALMR